MAKRPLRSFGIDELEEEFERCKDSPNSPEFKRLLAELRKRTVRRAKLLKERAEALKHGSPVYSPQRKDIARKIDEKLSPNSGKSSRAFTGRNWGIRHKPTAEQSLAIESFLKGGTLKINAYAGSGKTSTLQMLAQATGLKGQYLAFNSAIAKEAREKFPDTVACNTVHSLAFRATPSPYKARMGKMNGKMTANHLIELLKLEKLRIDGEHSLEPRSQGFLILQTIKRFAQSADTSLGAKHVPRHGSLIAASPAVIGAVNEFSIRVANHIWERMTNPDDPECPLGFDGYLKMWALSEPVIQADYIMLDEAQDTNPVVLEVLKKQAAQIVYVGDKYQQIYEWRGAVNAMDEMVAGNVSTLTQSFRFGEAIADVANCILRMLGETKPIFGNPNLNSRIGEAKPHAVLARTNAMTIAAMIDALDAGRKPHLVGDNRDLMAMLRGVEDLKKGEQSVVPEFFGFQNWQELVEFARSDEGEHLLTFVNLVETRGERQLKWALCQSVDEEVSDVVISTVFKAKGREWKTVKLMDDFIKSKPEAPGSKGILDKAELCVLYVAVTRAIEVLEMPSALLNFIKDARSPKPVAYAV